MANLTTTGPTTTENQHDYRHVPPIIQQVPLPTVLSDCLTDVRTNIIVVNYLTIMQEVFERF